MKKVVLLLSIVALCSFTIGSVINDGPMVWVCNSSNVYHRLASCSEVKKCNKPTRISLTIAEEEGMTPCSICYEKKVKQNAKATEAVKKSKDSQADKTVKPSPEKKVKETPAKKEKQATKTKKAKPEKKDTKQTKFKEPSEIDEESEAGVAVPEESDYNEDQDE